MKKYSETILYTFATLATIAIFFAFIVMPNRRVYGNESDDFVSNNGIKITDNKIAEASSDNYASFDTNSSSTANIETNSISPKTINAIKLFETGETGGTSDADGNNLQTASNDEPTAKATTNVLATISSIVDQFGKIISSFGSNTLIMSYDVVLTGSSSDGQTSLTSSGLATLSGTNSFSMTSSTHEFTGIQSVINREYKFNVEDIKVGVSSANLSSSSVANDVERDEAGKKESISISPTISGVVYKRNYNIVSVEPEQTTFTFDNETPISSISSSMSNKNKVSNVKLSSNDGITPSEVEVSNPGISITWDDFSGLYDPSKKGTQTFTVSGNLSDLSSKGVNNSSSVKATCNVIVNAQSPVDYDNIKEGTTSGDYKDVGITKVDIEKSLVKKILAAQTGDVRKIIDQAITDGSPLSVQLVVKEYDDEDDVSESGAASSIKDKAKDSKSGAKIGKYFDLSLYVVVGSNLDKDDKYKITDTGSDNEITIKYTIPSSLNSSSSSSSRSYKRYYRVYKYHGGEAHSASSEWKSGVSSISFKTTDFSTYGLAYYDESSSTSGTSGSGMSSSSRPSTSANIADTGDGTSGSRAPKTGDKFEARKWVFFLIIGVVVALCSFILYQDTRDFYDDSDYPKKKAKAAAENKK